MTRSWLPRHNFSFRISVCSTITASTDQGQFSFTHSVFFQMEIMIHSPNCRGCLVKKSRHTCCNYVSFPQMIFISTFFVLFPVYTRFFSTLVILCCCYWDRKYLCNFKHIFYSNRCVFQGGEPSKRPKGFPHDWFAAALWIWNTWPVPILEVTRMVHQKRGLYMNCRVLEVCDCVWKHGIWGQSKAWVKSTESQK